MGFLPQHAQGKALDGTIQPMNGAPVLGDSGNTMSLPSRPKPTGPLSSQDSIPPSGATLTGKQEHCKVLHCCRQLTAIYTYG